MTPEVDLRCNAEALARFTEQTERTREAVETFRAALARAREFTIHEHP